MSVTEDGYLLVALPDSTHAYVEVAPLTFRAVDRDSVIAFRENGEGAITHLFISGGTAAAFERVGIFRTGQAFFAAVVITVALALTTIMGAWMRRFRPKPEARPPAPARLAALASLATAALGLATLGVLLAALASAADVTLEYLFTWPDGLIVASQYLAIAFAIATAAAVAGLPAAWGLIGGRNGWPLTRRLHYTLFAFASGAMLALLWAWNLIGFKY